MRSTAGTLPVQEDNQDNLRKQKQEQEQEQRLREQQEQEKWLSQRRSEAALKAHNVKSESSGRAQFQASQERMRSDYLQKELNRQRNQAQVDNMEEDRRREVERARETALRVSRDAARQERQEDARMEAERQLRREREAADAQRRRHEQDRAADQLYSRSQPQFPYMYD